MAKKRISSVDLEWLILGELHDASSRATRMSLAVVSDDKHGWRAVVAVNSRRFITAESKRRLDAVQNRLRLKYELRS